MQKLSCEIVEHPEGYDFIRSDGSKFYLRELVPGGAAVLYTDDYADGSPRLPLTEFTRSVTDKRAAAERWILAYPAQPT